MPQSLSGNLIYAGSGPRYYQAYENDDRPAIEQLLHPGFTFTNPSPDDDRIDRATYFERCWPPHEGVKSFALLDVCADDNGALVRYRAGEFVGPGFASVELNASER